MARATPKSTADKRKRKADHVADSYEGRGVPRKEAKRRANATVTKQDGPAKRGAAKKTSQPAAKPAAQKRRPAAAARKSATPAKRQTTRAAQPSKPRKTRSPSSRTGGSKA